MHTKEPAIPGDKSKQGVNNRTLEAQKREPLAGLRQQEVCMPS